MFSLKIALNIYNDKKIGGKWMILGISIWIKQISKEWYKLISTKTFKYIAGRIVDNKGSYFIHIELIIDFKWILNWYWNECAIR